MRKLKNDELGRLQIGEFREAPKNPIVIVLDNVRSAYNVGSVFRTADAFRIEKVLLCGITGTPPNKEILKTSLGATESVKWEYRKESREAVLDLKNQGFMIYVVEQADKSIGLQDFVPVKGSRIALVFGHEVFGVDEELLLIADGSIEIPQFGTKHSFNVAVTVGIILWDIHSKMR